MLTDTPTRPNRANANTNAGRANTTATTNHAPTEATPCKQKERAPMKDTLLESSAISAFCQSVGIMYAAGIQTDEAVAMLMDNLDDAPFKRTCESVYAQLAAGTPLSRAMRASSSFPDYACNMVEAGEASGRLENVLSNLAVYYDEEDRLFAKIKSSVGYPAALLCIMTVILAFTVAIILPVFVNVYEGISGNLTTSSFSSVGLAIGIGKVALGITFLSAAVAVYLSAMCNTQAGRIRMMHLFEALPITKNAMYQLALSRFASALGTYLSAGSNMDAAMRNALGTVEHKGLKAKLEETYAAMTDVNQGKSLAQAITENNVFEPVYARMLAIGARSGSMEQVLESLSTAFFEDATMQLDRVVDNTEPALAAFMTIAVGATLIAVMMPLIGMMGSIA